MSEDNKINTENKPFEMPPQKTKGQLNTLFGY